MIDSANFSNLLLAAKKTLDEGRDSSGVLIMDPRKSKEEIKKKNTHNKDSVCGACVMCKSATPDSKPIHMKKDDQLIEISGLSKLSVKDITLSKPFKGCKNKGSCIVNESVIENQEWYDTSIGENTVNGQGELNSETSYMICTVGPGIIYFVNAGQNLKDFIDEVPTENIKLLELAQLIKNCEIGNIKDARNKNYTTKKDGTRAIIIQNANDGYVTIGYGLAIQTDADASKYGFDVIRSDPKYANFDFSQRHSVKEINDIIKMQQDYYNSIGQDNPAELTLEEAEILLLEELNEKRHVAVQAIGVASLGYSKNKIDAVTSVLYNGNHYTDPDSLSYNLIHGSKEDALNIIHEAENKGWYHNSGGTLRRRLMEVNMFYNDDYSFYDSGDLDQLKKDTGYSP